MEITDQMKKECYENYFVNFMKGLYYLSFAYIFEREKYNKANVIYASL